MFASVDYCTSNGTGEVLAVVVSLGDADSAGDHIKVFTPGRTAPRRLLPTNTGSRCGANRTGHPGTSCSTSLCKDFSADPSCPKPTAVHGLLTFHASEQRNG